MVIFRSSCLVHGLWMVKAGEEWTMNLRIYYAHSFHLYGSKQESRDLELLSSLGFSVLNPNRPHHQDRYKEKGMKYFTEDILPRCDFCAFRAYPGGNLPAGVAKEVVCFQTANKPVIEIPNFYNRRILSVEETRLFLAENGQR